MKIKHCIYALLLTGAGTLATSCDSYLEEELISGVSAATYYPTVSGFEDAVKATYSFMKPFYGVERGFTMTIFGTDTYTNGADGSYKGINAYDGRLNGADNFIQDTWSDLYRGINQANAVINRSADLEGMTEEEKTARLAEVRFLRGLYYFDLVRFYGDVHLSLEETQGVEIEANRTPQSEIYKQAIIPDLEFAINNLPAVQDDYGRATKPAAEFLLAKVLMTRAYTGFSESGDAARAESLMTSVIENYDFELLDDFADLWDINNEQNSEVIFTVQNSKSQVDEGIDGNGHRGHLYFLMEYDNLPGMTRDITNGRPWKRFRPTDYTLNLWDRSVDTRYDKSFKHVWYANNESTIPTWSAEEAAAGYGTEGQPKFGLGDTAVYIPGPQMNDEWPQSRQARTPYLVYTDDEYTERKFPSLNKWIDPTRPNRQHTQGQRDFILMRLADAYLIRAEARLMQGDTEGAAEDINVIRVRSAAEGMEEDIKIDASQVNLDFLLDERARELVGEGHRWFDLTRTGTLIERVRRYNPEGGPNIESHHILRPIPQDQIDRTLGGYPQNPGYNV
ncbi:RagB/SusD family nutrient uptake outer membrane protein [Neolewinella litorea]|uniref:RagB/SusD family nutrient uptake outer membrane protein n=1 Tax=Neolewinella litorea TaxID=2562452 RepID=UPI001B3BE35A|nr:RagB/SusD family nutrient uptake outer membrane protein [Neolewinella litorea]